MLTNSTPWENGVVMENVHCYKAWWQMVLLVSCYSQEIPLPPRNVNWFLGQMLWCLSVKTQLFSSSISQSCFILGLIGLGAGRGCMIAHGTGGETALTLHLLPQTSTYSLPQRSTLRAIQSTFMPGLLTSLLLLSISFLSSLGAFTWAFWNHITCLLCLQNKTLRARHTRSCQLSTDFPYNFLCSSYCY